MVEKTLVDTSIINDEKFQLGIVELMLRDKGFLRLCRANVPDRIFIDPHVAQIVKIIYKQYDATKETMSSQEELNVFIRGTFYGDRLTTQKHIDKAAIIYAWQGKYHESTIKTNMTGWMQLNVLKQQLPVMVDLSNKGNLEEVSDSLVPKLGLELQRVRFNVEAREEIKDLEKFYSDFDSSNTANCCTMGHDDLDEMMRTGAKIVGPNRGPELKTRTRGGLMPGQTTVILAPTNTGKTTAILTVAVSNVYYGKNVFVVGHEQSSKEMIDKCLRSASGLRKHEFDKMARTPNDPLGKALKKVLNERLFYHHWVKTGNMYVESVLPLIIQCHERLLDETGEGLHLVICDYPGILKSKVCEQRRMKTYEEMTYVYEQFVSIAKEYGFHCLLPAQVNREGFKLNKGSGESRLLNSGDAAGSFNLSHSVDNLITLNRSSDDHAKQRIKFHLSKCRTAPSETTFVSRTDFDSCRTHGWDLSSRVFRAGEMPTDEACDVFFNPESIGVSGRVDVGSIFAPATMTVKPPQRTLEEAHLSVAMKNITKDYPDYLDSVEADGDKDYFEGEEC